MLSITDLLDFIDLDIDAVYVVNRATQLPLEEAATLAGQLLKTGNGVSLLHLMYRDQIAAATAKSESFRLDELDKAYTYFARKYPMLQPT